MGDGLLPLVLHMASCRFLRPQAGKWQDGCPGAALRLVRWGDPRKETGKRRAGRRLVTCGWVASQERPLGGRGAGCRLRAKWSHPTTSQSPAPALTFRALSPH